MTQRRSETQGEEPAAKYAPGAWEAAVEIAAMMEKPKRKARKRKNAQKGREDKKE